MGADHYGSISIYIDRDKKIWTCGWTIGINCLDPETGIWKNFFLENLHNEPELVYKIIPAGKNELWLGSYDQGLIRFNTVSGSCQYYQNNPFQPKSLLFDQVSGLFTDRDTSLWVLHDNINGSCKAANGYAALFYNSSGSYNTVIEAGDGNAIGRGGGNYTNATALGANSTINASNKIRLGDTLVTVIEGAVAYTYPSDMRLKKNIIDIGAGTEFIKKLRPVQFQYKKSTDGPQNWGFIAQDIEAIVGHDNAILTISGDAQKTLGLRYTDFIAPMVKAIQEQQSTIEQLKKENASLKDRLDKIEALLEKK